MKKVILALLLCFAAVNAFALTAEEVFRKSEAKDLSNNFNFQSYEVEYEMVPGVPKDPKHPVKNMVCTLKETVDGANRRMEAKVESPEMGGYIYSSLIMADGVTYVSDKYVSSKGTIVFNDYKVVNDTKSVSTYSNTNAKKETIYESLKLSFDTQIKSSKEYVVNMSVKDPDKIEQNIKEKRAAGEEITSEEFALSIMSSFDSKIFIDKNTFLTNIIKIKISEDTIYKSISKSDEYKDKSEEERRKLAKEKAGAAGSFADVIYSGYKQIAGTKLFYASEVVMKSPLFTEYYVEGVYYIIKTKSFKILKDGETGLSAFVPTNIKKGKGKVPKEFTQQADIYGEMLKLMKKELIKSLKESIKQSVKEEGKKMVKDGAKSVTKEIFKGLGGF